MYIQPVTCLKRNTLQDEDVRCAFQSTELMFTEQLNVD